MKQRKKLNKNISLENNKFIQSLEAVGDLLVFETEQKKINSEIINSLDRIVEIQKKIFQNKDKINKNYNIYFEVLINQIIRIHFSGVEAKNDEIGRNAVYRIIWILEELSKGTNNKIDIQLLMSSLFRIMKVATNKNDISMYSSSFHWYKTIFSNDFKIEYLDFFNTQLFSFIHHIISNDFFSLFKSFVSFSVESIFIESTRETIWEYNRLVNFEIYQQIREKIDKKRLELESNINYLYKNKELNNWLVKFQELKNDLMQYFSGESEAKAKNIEDEIIKTTISKFKYNNLLEIIFELCAYCLFKMKIDYIKYIWDYKQPPDSDATWVGHDIIPTNLAGLINLFFSRYSTNRIIDSWEDHRGTSLYYDRYFLLLLMNILKRSRIDLESEETFKFLGRYNIISLHDIESYIDYLINIANGLKSQKGFQDLFDFTSEEFEKNLDSKVIDFLEKLKSFSKSRINDLIIETDISLKRIELFKKKVLAGFNNINKLRDIFIFYKKHDYKIEMGKVNDTVELIAFEDFCEKVAFIENWYVDYTGFGEKFGSDIALNENVNLFKNILDGCEKIEEKFFLKILNKIRNYTNYIMVLNDFNLYQYSLLYKNFILKSADDKQFLEINNFSGWYKIKNNKIPIFKFNYNKIDKGLLLLNVNNMGRLITYTIHEDNNVEKSKKNIINIKITEFSKNTDTIKYFLKRRPIFFNINTSEMEKENFFKSHVLINIYGKFEYRKFKNFNGFFMKLR